MVSRADMGGSIRHGRACEENKKALSPGVPDDRAIVTWVHHPLMSNCISTAIIDMTRARLQGSVIG